jgi:hypothetical protein
MATDNFSPLEFLDLISLLKPKDLIIVLDKGIELEQIEAIATNDPDASSRVRQARLVRSFLYAKVHGLKTS